MSTTANNYAFEIRFVDDNIVQVFDIAAKRQQHDINNFLPTEYKQDEVLKGQLRYSKLVGSAPSTHQKDTFGLEEDGQPYKHIVTTKRSENRRSTQRHTFFMMGGGGGNSRSDINVEDVIDMAYDSGTAVSEEETIELSSHVTCHQDEKQIDINNHWGSEIDSIRSSSHAVSPKTLESPTPALSPPLTPPTNHQQHQEPEPVPETMITRPLSPQLPKEPKQILVKPRTSLKSPYRNTQNNDYIPYKESNHYTIAALTKQQSVIEPPRSTQKTVESIPHVTTQQETSQPANFYPEDYASLSVVETNGHDSRRNMNQDHVEKAPKRGCCCIIS